MSSCRFNPSNLADSIPSIDSWLEADSVCNHVIKSELNARNVSAYCIMDACCEVHFPDLDGPCKKPDTAKLWVLISKEVIRTSSRPVLVSYSLKSYQPNRLLFKDTETDEAVPMLDFSSDPLCIGSPYPKMGNQAIDLNETLVHRVPQTGPRHAQIEIGFSVWKDSEGKDRYSTQPIRMAITLPRDKGETRLKEAGKEAGNTQKNVTKILYLCANPIESESLRLDEEIKTIERKLNETPNRDKFIFKAAMAVEHSELSALLMRHEPDIVHFAGHGDYEGLVFQNHNREPHWIKADVLKQLFEQHGQNVRCVVLNACYSESQAKAICNAVGCVVGMEGEIGDEEAKTFAGGFYQSLGYGNNVEEAVHNGELQIKIAGLEYSGPSRVEECNGIKAAEIYFAK